MIAFQVQIYNDIKESHYFSKADDGGKRFFVIHPMNLKKLFQYNANFWLTVIDLEDVPAWENMHFGLALDENKCFVFKNTVLFAFFTGSPEFYIV